MAEQYVHLAREDEDKTVCDLDLFDAESGVGIEATHRGPGRFHTVTCPACLHGEIRRLTEAHSEEARRLAAALDATEHYVTVLSESVRQAVKVFTKETRELTAILSKEEGNN